MKESNVKRNKLDKKDINKVGLYSLMYQTGFNFERMQAGSFAQSLIPGLKKIYGDQKEEIGSALSNNLEFINTEQHVASFLLGLVLSLEEAGEDRNLIRNLKTGLFAPLAGIGDSIYWFTLLPISSAIAVSLNQQGLILGPIFFMAFWFIVSLVSKVYLTRAGYAAGINALSTIKENATILMRIASILGVMVVGGLIPSYVEFEFKESLTFFGEVPVQEIFNEIIPNLLPMLFVFALYYLIKNRKANVVYLILGVIIFSIGISALGLM